MAASRIQFGDFEFDTGSGELRRNDGGADADSIRLSPQPAALLSLLAAKKGELVTREEIRDTLWPDAKVEFDTGLHFCVRQIRSALGDSASNAQYIETLPRRGYRLIPAVTSVVAAEDPPPTSGRRNTIFAIGVIAVLVIAVLLQVSGAKPSVRIGVMPFLPPDDSSWPGVVSPIAEWVLEDLTNGLGSDVGIIGPTTTSAYQESEATMDRLADEYHLDYLVNGRFIVYEDGARMFAELIRISDGVHIWVKSYDDLSEGRRIGLEISANVARELGAVQSSK